MKIHLSQNKCDAKALLEIWKNKKIKIVKAKKIKKPFSWDTYGGNPHFPNTTILTNTVLIPGSLKKLT